EEAEVLETLLAAAHLGGREGIAFGQAKFPADHLVQSARVARNVDTLDIDTWTFLDVEGDVDSEIVPVAPDVGANVDKGVSQRPDRVGHGLDSLVDIVGI